MVSRRATPLPTSVWDAAALLRYCLSDVLPYTSDEVDATARRNAVFPVSWPVIDEARLRDTQIAVRDIVDAPLVPTADGKLGPVGRYAFSCQLLNDDGCVYCI